MFIKDKSIWQVINKRKNYYQLQCIKGNCSEDYKVLYNLPDDNLYEEITKKSQRNNSEQISGCHYSKLQIQPDEYAHKNVLNFMQGNAIKYITRYKDKNGKEDLLKAISVIHKLIEFEYPNEPVYNTDVKKQMNKKIENLQEICNNLFSELANNLYNNQITTKTNNNGR
jgi:hypothetical protein